MCNIVGSDISRIGTDTANPFSSFNSLKAKIGVFGGRRFYIHFLASDGTDHSFKDIVKAIKPDFFKKNSSRLEMEIRTRKEILSKLKSLDQKANELLQSKNIVVKILTYIRQFFGNLRFDKEAALKELEDHIQKLETEYTEIEKERQKRIRQEERNQKWLEIKAAEDIMSTIPIQYFINRGDMIGEARTKFDYRTIGERVVQDLLISKNNTDSWVLTTKDDVSFIDRYFDVMLNRIVFVVKSSELDQAKVRTPAHVVMAQLVLSCNDTEQKVRDAIYKKLESVDLDLYERVKALVAQSNLKYISC